MKKSYIIIIAVVVVIASIIIGVFIGKGIREKENETEVSSTTLEQTEVVADTTLEKTETTTETETETETQTEIETQTETVAETVENKIGDTISTDYYSISVPASWNGKYSYEVRENYDNEGYSINVRHKDSYGIGYGGLLFSINMYSVAQGDGQFIIDEQPVPVEYLGVLKVPGAEDFDVIVMFPSDAQFSDGTMDEYYELFNSNDSVFKTFTATNGATFEKA